MRVQNEHDHAVQGSAHGKPVHHRGAWLASCCRQLNGTEFILVFETYTLPMIQYVGGDNAGAPEMVAVYSDTGM